MKSSLSQYVWVFLKPSPLDLAQTAFTVPILILRSYLLFSWSADNNVTFSKHMALRLLYTRVENGTSFSLDY